MKEHDKSAFTEQDRADEFQPVSDILQSDGVAEEGRESVDPSFVAVKERAGESMPTALTEDGKAAEKQTAYTAEPATAAQEDPLQKAARENNMDINDPHINNEITKVTGRPVFTAEDNEAFKRGPVLFRKAMESRSRAMGEEYEPYRIPAHMRAALRRIDEESALDAAREKAALEGKNPDEIDPAAVSHLPLESLHTVDPDEDDELKRKAEEERRIQNGGARFYGKYKALMEKNEASRDSINVKLRRNLKLAFIVLVALGSYIVYRDFIDQDKTADSINELKAAIPLQIDKHTALVRIDDRNDEFKIYFEKDPAVFEGFSEEEKEAALSNIENAAPLLCNNALLNSIVTEGRKVTVLLDAADGSFHRELVMDKCPAKDSEK